MPLGLLDISDKMVALCAWNMVNLNLLLLFISIIKWEKSSKVGNRLL